MKFMSGIMSGEGPVDNCSGIFALGPECGYLSSQLCFIRYSAPQEILAEDTQFYLRNMSQLPCFGA